MSLFNRKKKDGFLNPKIENLIDWNEPNGNGCIVSDKITKEGFKVGYMYREEPDGDRPDSGWRFLAGNEDEVYMNNPNHHHVFAINTVCNYDTCDCGNLCKRIRQNSDLCASGNTEGAVGGILSILSETWVFGV